MGFVGLTPRLLLANVAQLRIARRPVDVNEIARIYSPIVNDARVLQVVERDAKGGAKTG